MNRRALLAVVVVTAVLSASIAWALGRRIESPAEAADRAAAPAPSLITVPVESKELSSRVVVRGTVQSSEETAIEVSTAALGNPVVTGLPKSEDDELVEGEVAIEITGRPVIVLEGTLPTYRSMVPASQGPDVRQLEEALIRLGFDPGEVDDQYTTATASAVAALYESLGYRANGPTTEDDEAVDLAEDRVQQADKALKAAQSSGTDEGGVPESVRLQQNQLVDQAQRRLDDAKAGTTPELQQAKSVLDDAESALKDANDSLAAAKDRLAQAQNQSEPDTGDQGGGEADGADGQSQPDDGQAAPQNDLAGLRQAVVDAEAVVAEATSARDRAKEEYDQANSGQTQAIKDAETDLAIAKATRSETFADFEQSADSGADGQQTIAELREDLQEARDDLAEIRSVTGVSVPLEELVFVPTLPRKVSSVGVELGSTAAGAVMSLTGPSTIIDSVISASDRRLIDEGMEAIVEDDDLGVSVSATISFVAANPGGGDIPEDRYAMRLEPNEELPEEAFFQSLRVTIPISSTSGEVLVVPLAAVSAGPDGTSRVEVQAADESTTLVEVTTGLAADGFVEIAPITGSLSEGDRVVVGRELLLPTDDGEQPDDDGSDGGGDSEDEPADDSGDESDGEA